MSLHQPRSDAFPLFSRILLLSSGSIVYSGPTVECLPYFRSIGFQPQERTNPLDFLIDISSVDTRDEDEERESRERVERLIQCWKEKENTAGAKVDLEPEKAGKWTRPNDLEASASTPPSAASSSSESKRPNVFQQTIVLVPRATKNMIRAYPELIGHFVQAVFLGVIMGITFFQLGGQPNDIQSLKTVAFQVVPFYSYLTQIVWTYKWCTNLVVFDRELEDNLYEPASWVLSEYLAWLPMNVFAPFVYSTIVYFVCGLRTDDLHYNYGIFVIDLIMIQLCFISWSLFAASIEVRCLLEDPLRGLCSLHSCSQRSFARASLFGNALSIFFILSPGFFIVNVPGWIRWFRWLSPHYFSFRIIVISQFRNRTFSCEGVTGPALSQCDGANVLRGLRISPSEPIWPMFMGNLAFILVMLFLSWLLLTTWKPGGVRHAPKVSSDHKGKEHSASDIDITRARIDVVAEQVKLFHVRRTFPSFTRIETPILADITARFPSGEVSVIMGPSGSGKSTFLRMCAGRPLKAGLTSSFQPGGKILFNGVPVSKRTRHVSAFVEQGTGQTRLCLSEA